MATMVMMMAADDDDDGSSGSSMILDLLRCQNEPISIAFEIPEEKDFR